MKADLIALLIATFFAAFFLESFLPYQVKAGFYTFSYIVKEILVTIVPFMVFIFLFNSLILFRHKALGFVTLLLLSVSTSNFTAIITGYSVGSAVLPNINMQNNENIEAINTLMPLVNFSIPRVTTNEIAIFFGIFCGLIFAFKQNEAIDKISAKSNAACIAFLNKFFIPILPLFIFGFLLKIQYENALGKLLGTYGIVVIFTIFIQLSYASLLFFIAGGFNFKHAINYIKNSLPAVITAFSTISSAATIPVTVSCAEKNLNDPKFAKIIVPATANIHSVGSAIGMTILVLTTILAFGYDIPSINHFIIFAFAYTAAKYAAIGIPGGGILIVTPLLETYLNFTPEMIGMLTSMYLLFDPFGTTCNVACNNAFAILFSKAYKASPYSKEMLKANR